MTPLVTLCCAHLVIIETCKTKHWQQSYKYNLKHMITKKQTNRSTYQKIKNKTNRSTSSVLSHFCRLEI